jgi:hypothetical protein
MGVLLAERLFPGSSPDPIVIVDTASNAQETPSAQPTEFVFPPKQKQVNARKPLNQPPLGETGSWATAVRHGKQKQAQSSTMSSRWFQEEEVDSRQGKKAPSKEEIFVKAVKEAERSILVFNLDLGQQPSMNSATISSKVTFSLVSTLDKKEKRPSPSQESKDFVDDILSQVVRMEFLAPKPPPVRTLPTRHSMESSTPFLSNSCLRTGKPLRLQLTFCVSSWESTPPLLITDLSGLQ